MARLSWKRLPYLFLTVYIALAVTGAFSFAALDTLRSFSFEAESPISGAVLDSPGDYFIQYQAEEPAVIAKAGKTQFFPLRMGFQRTASLFVSPNSGDSFSKSPFRFGAAIQYTDLKKNILLKLRI